jgi:hypothetical protein
MAVYTLRMTVPRLQYRVSDSDSNAAYEFAKIQERQQSQGPSRPNVLVPLMLSGDYGSAFPPGVERSLIRDSRGLLDQDITVPGVTQFIRLVTGVSNPLGLIPMIYGIQHPHSAYPHYQAIAGHVHFKCTRFDRQHERKQTYQQGKVAERQGDLNGASALFLTAAQAGHPKAMIKMATLILLAHQRGERPDLRAGLAWARQGLTSVPASQRRLRQEAEAAVVDIEHAINAVI